MRIVLGVATTLGLWAAPARATEPEVIVGGPKVLIAFHPGGGPPQWPSVFERIVARETLSLGLLGATQGAYSVRQTLLDITQGARVSRSGYDPDDLPELRLRLDGGGGRIAGWERAVRRADSAVGDIVPGRLATVVPGGAAYVAPELPRRLYVDAVVAADLRGRVAEVSLGPAADVAARARAALEHRSLVVVGLPPGPTGDQQLDELIGRRGKGELLLVIRTPPRTRVSQLLPVGAAGLSSEAGLLTSRTTRHDGLVAALDIVPTVMRQLERPVPDGVTGRPIEVAEGRDVGGLLRFEKRLRAVFPRRFPSLYAIAATLAALALGLVLAGGPPGRPRALRVVALSAMWIPGMALVTAVLSPSRDGELILMALGTVTLGLLTDRLVPWPRGPAVPAIAGVCAYVVDLAFGSPLIVRSLLGPNPRFGARFYGIGNELEAILPVLLLVGIAAAAGVAARSRRLALIFGAAMLVLGACVGAGRLGADVGGVISIGAGGAAAVLLALPGRRSWRGVVIACAVPAVALGALALVDVVTGGDAHFTNTILGAGSGGELADIAQRRFSLAWDAFNRGLMPLATVAALAALVVGWRRRRQLLAPVDGHPAWVAALGGGAAAGVVGMLANDSGPVLLVLAVAVLVFTAGYLRGAPAVTADRAPALSAD